MVLQKLFPAIFLVLFFSSCTNDSKSDSNNDSTKNEDSSASASTSSVSSSQTALNVKDPEAELLKKFKTQYLKWKGTPYKYGGSDLRGVDCSALVQNIYASAVNVQLPRVTRTQVKEGVFVKRNALQVGDLVFFKTSPTVNHNGIYIGNGEFIHASSSRGVMISLLDNVYWKKRYWQSRRILN